MLYLSLGKEVYLKTRCNFTALQKGDFDVLIRRPQIPLASVNASVNDNVLIRGNVMVEIY